MEAVSVIKDINNMTVSFDKIIEVCGSNSSISKGKFLKYIDEFRTSFNGIMDYLLREWERDSENKYEPLLMFRYKSKFFKGIDTLFLVELRFGEEVFIEYKSESKDYEFNKKFEWYKEHDTDFVNLVEAIKTCFGV